MSDLHRRLVQNRMGRPPRGLPTGRSSVGLRGRNLDFSPKGWQEYFDEFVDLSIPDVGTFRCYISGWKESATDQHTPLLLLLHGGGYSGLTWSLFTKEIRALCECKVAAIDLRSHGDSKTQSDEDLSIERLALDVGAVYEALISHQQGTDDSSELDHPNVILIGHSMGGAAAVHVASHSPALIPSLIGLVVIDVVEGSAMEALQTMYSVISSRPQSFSSLWSAIEWSVKSGQTRNLEASRVSMPGQLIYSPTRATATSRVGLSEDSDSQTTTPSDTAANCIQEEAEDEKIKCDEHITATNHFSPTNSLPYIWRIDLKKTDPHWTGWFQGLSNRFLSNPVDAKLLLLAGVDRLDRELTIGQMQGKFQMIVLPQVGHIIHEDAPDKVAEAIATFLVRNRFARASEGFVPMMPGC